MRDVVCIQGLGFVGAAMSVACARAGTRYGGDPFFDVIGLDLPNSVGESRIREINNGRFPFKTTDRQLVAEAELAHKVGNLRATDNTAVLREAKVIVVDVHFDIGDLAGEGQLELDAFLGAIETVGKNAAPGALVVVETTVPPGTCAKLIRPVLDKCCQRRGLPAGSILLAHAYERVMPGDRYLSSITDFWRVFAGETKAGGDACAQFLSKVVNVQDYPLTQLSSTTASETAKVLENSYRAMNIAFIDEWGHFAENVGIDMFEILEAIRLRPTHNNIRQPGFGVGGYCLTKDPLFAELAARDIFHLTDIAFPMSRAALKINHDMPLHALRKVKYALGGMKDRRILLAGISYRQDVADTRYSPSQIFYEAALAEGAQIVCFDPLVSYWEELGVAVEQAIERCPDVSAVVFVVPHKVFKEIAPEDWLDGNTPYILDANDCFTANQRLAFRASGCHIESVGRGM